MTSLQDAVTEQQFITHEMLKTLRNTFPDARMCFKSASRCSICNKKAMKCVVCGRRSGGNKQILTLGPVFDEKTHILHIQYANCCSVQCADIYSEQQDALLSEITSKFQKQHSLRSSFRSSTSSKNVENTKYFFSSTNKTSIDSTQSEKELQELSSSCENEIPFDSSSSNISNQNKHIQSPLKRHFHVHLIEYFDNPQQLTSIEYKTITENSSNTLLFQSLELFYPTKCLSIVFPSLAILLNARYIIQGLVIIKKKTYEICYKYISENRRMRWEVLDEKTTTEFLKVRVEIMRRVHRLFSLLAVIVALQIQDYNLFNDFVETARGGLAKKRHWEAIAMIINKQLEFLHQSQNKNDKLPQTNSQNVSQTNNSVTTDNHKETNSEQHTVHKSSRNLRVSEARLRTLLGETYQALRKFDEALQQYDAAIALCEQESQLPLKIYLEVLKYAAVLYDQMGFFSKAAEYYAKALKYTKDPEIREYLKEDLKTMKRYSKQLEKVASMTIKVNLAPSKPTANPPKDQQSTVIETCAYCHKKGTGLPLCGRCLRAHYCSVDCQRNDWPKHRETCCK